jgi:hypothetical protein
LSTHTSHIQIVLTIIFVKHKLGFVYHLVVMI